MYNLKIKIILYSKNDYQSSITNINTSTDIFQYFPSEVFILRSKKKTIEKIKKICLLLLIPNKIWKIYIYKKSIQHHWNCRIDQNNLKLY